MACSYLCADLKFIFNLQLCLLLISTYMACRYVSADIKSIFGMQLYLHIWLAYVCTYKFHILLSIMFAGRKSIYGLQLCV